MSIMPPVHMVTRRTALPIVKRFVGVNVSPREVSPSRRMVQVRWLILDAIGRTRYGKVWGSQDAWKSVDPQVQGWAIDYLRELGHVPAGWEFQSESGPGEFFDSFVDQCVSGVKVSFPEPQEPRPTAEDRVEVGPVAEAEWAGFTLGLAGHGVVCPKHYSPEEQEAFLRGHRAGFSEFEATELQRFQEEHDRMEEAFSDQDRMHDAERTRGRRVCVHQ